MSALVSRSDRNGAAVLTLDSPQNRNALSRPMVEQMESLLSEVASDSEARAVVLTATGGTFCAGADLTDPPLSSGQGSYTDVLRTLWDFPKPVIVAINGHVRAGGFGMLAAADVVVAVDTATFAFTEVRIGVSPAIISVMCLRRMTPLAASRYLLTGEQFDAEAAMAAGLVTSVVDAEALDPAVEVVIESLRHCEPTALRVTRDLMRRLPELGVAAGFTLAERVSQEMFASEAASEGMAAFKEKRLPAWARSD